MTLIKTAAVVAVLVAYIPMLSFLNANPYAYFLYRFNFATLALLVATFLIVPTVVLTVAGFVIRRIASADWAERALIAFLVMVLWRQVDVMYLRPWTETGGGVLIRGGALCAALLVTGVAASYGRVATRRWLNLLVIPVLIATIWMTASQILRVHRMQGVERGPVARGALATNNIYVVLIDGFPLSYVQTDDGFVDPKFAPNLAGFARRDAIWAAANGSNGSSTIVSVPSMLTGRFDTTDVYGFGNQEASLLELAAPTYHVTAFVPSLNITCLPDRYRCYPPPKPRNQLLALRMVAANYFEMTEPRVGLLLTGGESINWRTLPFENAESWDVLPRATSLVRQQPGPGNFMLVHTFFQEPAAKTTMSELEQVNEARRALLVWDANFGAFLDTLRSTGTYQSSIVAVVSDHGKDFSQPALYGPRTVPNARILRTLMAIKPLGTGQPRAIRTRTQNIDLLPTLAELAGLELPRTIVDRFDGRSLAAQNYRERPHYFLVLGSGMFRFDWASGEFSRIDSTD